MSDTVIRVEGLGKRYRIGANRERYVALRDVIANGTKALGRRLLGRGPARPRYEEFWALKDVSFEVKRGECVGIIGRNGAGKSTLLKLLSRITEPTAGRFRLRGRVASLLEVGTGFHPELTGRENVFLNGAILGMGRREIARRFGEIVSFAEVETFLDTPVKHYSSGMYMRLAFAVAAHLEPEILVVDEVLAVGDAGFQAKCLGKMGEVANRGRTVLFVSHNMGAIQRLCNRAILLRKGRTADSGTAERVVSAYLREYQQDLSFHRARNSSGKPTITAASIVADQEVSDVIVVDMAIESGIPAQVSIDVRLTDYLGNPVAFGSLGALAGADLVPVPSGSSRVNVGIDVRSLATGEYIVSLDLTNPEVEFYDRSEQCLRFEVVRRTAQGRALPQAWGYGSYELPIHLRSSR